jgi:hypothetical protein
VPCPQIIAIAIYLISGVLSGVLPIVANSIDAGAVNDIRKAIIANRVMARSFVAAFLFQEYLL